MRIPGGRAGNPYYLSRLVDGISTTVRSSQRAQILHLAVTIQKGMSTGLAHHLPRLVETPSSSSASFRQRAQIGHLAVTIQKGMSTGLAHHLSRLVETVGVSGLTPQRPQV